ncbi:type II toxin-antitoxin system PemK/MazF family toxin [Comamonas jiangduensis]|jgi:uncharacterized protein YifN (PemK superfamily)|uniref:type II toxin-antitoxin system PemK/MazF family toxin n=1 Tax=Comamonas jiangduensis TaxID=1194168 RepID=UPI003BF80C96
MAKTISKNPKRGDIYECLFGHFLPVDPAQPQGPFRKDNFDYRIPNEIRKRRPVVILSDRSGQFIVVPISTREDIAKKAHKKAEAQGIHVRIPEGAIPETGFYKKGTLCWAKADLIQTVDVKRLREFPKGDGTHVTGAVDGKTLQEIQDAVLRALGLKEKNRLTNSQKQTDESVEEPVEEQA